ncbi:MAG: ABC transporter permease [Desulfurococcales archaeon]|nr:ABC transporter permease [Desulfurococcales archaeon]
MKIARAGLRLVYKKRLETIVLVILVVLVVFQHGFLELTRYNVGYHIYGQLRDEMGDLALIVPEADAGKATRLLEDLGASRVEASTFYLVKLSIGNKTMLAPLITLEELERFSAIAALKAGTPPGGPGEAGIYTVVASGARGMSLDWIEPGMEASVEAYTPRGPLSMSLTVTGVYKGFSWVAGYPYAVVLPSLPDALEGQGIVVASAWLDQGDPEAAAEGLASQAKEHGIPVYGILVNTPEKNPIVMLVKSAFNLLSIPASIMLAFAFILPAAAGTVSVFRDLRSLAVLRAMGAGVAELSLYYTLPWIVRGLLGAVIATILLALYSDDVYFSIFVGDSDIARAMAEAYGFKLDPATLLRASLIALAMVVAGGLVPLAAASRVRMVEVLRSGEVPLAWIPPRIALPGPLQLRSSLRDLIARWWKLVGMVLALGLLWSVSTALEMETGSLDSIVEFIQNEYPVDVYAGFISLASQPPEPVAGTIQGLIASDSRVLAYTLYYSESTVTDLPGGYGRVFMMYITVLGGDPEVGFPLEDGRYPQRAGETVISKYMASYLGVGLGDKITLDSPTGGNIELTIVGLSVSMINNGFHALVVPGSGIFQADPGLREVVVMADLVDGVDPGEYARELKEARLPPYITATQVFIRDDVVDSLNTMTSMVRVFYSGIAILTAIAAGIALSGVLLVDASARAREHGVLLAIGSGRRHILLGYIAQALASFLIAAPLALALGYLTALATARGTALALGYVPPTPRISALASSLLWISLIVSLALALAAVLLHLRRLRLAEVLRE